MAISKTSKAIQKYTVQLAKDGKASIQEIAREFEISAAAIYAQLKRERDLTRCPCCGQVVKEGFKIDRTVLKPGVKNAPAN